MPPNGRTKAKIIILLSRPISLIFCFLAVMFLCGVYYIFFLTQLRGRLKDTNEIFGVLRINGSSRSNEVQRTRNDKKGVSKECPCPQLFAADADVNTVDVFQTLNFNVSIPYKFYPPKNLWLSTSSTLPS